MLVTGCLHEDGLADIADGFGGGKTRERKLEIMRDSRIGTFGAWRWLMSLLIALERAGRSSSTPGWCSAGAGRRACRLARAAACLHAAGAAGRQRRPVGRRRHGLRQRRAGRRWRSARVALLPLGLGRRGRRGHLLWPRSSVGFRRALPANQIGGQTGDMLGALQQVGEIAVLLVAAVRYSHLTRSGESAPCRFTSLDELRAACLDLPAGRRCRGGGRARPPGHADQAARQPRPAGGRSPPGWPAGRAAPCRSSTASRSWSSPARTASPRRASRPSRPR